MTITVCLNGTNRNPFHRWGLRQNPFPQMARAEYDAADRRLNSLGGEPIPDVEYIRKTLSGFSPEFVELCCSKFVKGEYVRFRVTFPD